MAVLIWLRFVFLFGFSHCYINLSRKPTTTVTQSSTYTGSIFHNASLATDGTRKTKEEFCSHTDVNHTKAWFQVDLGGLYSIKSVQIFYRKEGDGESDWKQYRFRQFYLEVSQAPANTTTAQRIRCYKDNTTAPDLPENIINITCVQTARYVIVETTYEAKEDDENNVYGAILEICEIEVYGCAVGEYGAECEPCLGCSTCDIEHGCRCSEHCKNNSCNDSRVCIQGCNSGYWGQTCEADCSSYCVNNTCLSDGRCTEMCEAGDWGHNCSSQCPQNCNQPTCSRDNGHCASCKPNWIGDQCNRCDSTHYGTDCSLACSINCTGNICNKKGYCTDGCKMGTYGDMCQKQCSTCNANCDRITGQCIGECPTGKFGTYCEEMCDQLCSNGCMKSNGVCNSCDDKKYGDYCNKTCSPQCQSACDQQSGSCECISGWTGTACNEALTADEFPVVTAVGAGVGGLLFIVVAVVIVVFVVIRKRHKDSKSASSVLYHKSAFDQDESKGYTNLGGITEAIEDPDEEPQIEKPEECVYYNNLSVAKDIPVSDLLNIITTKQAKENEGFLKEFKSLPYGERFPCEVSKSAENMPKNRFKTTFPYDHSRVVLESSKEFNSDYINANYIENMDGKREFIASQGPRVNTVVDHWRMIWQEHVNYIVMLTNLIEGPKVKCHQYWPEAGKEMDVDPFSLTLLEEKVYAYFVVRKMAVRKKKVTGSRTVVQFHYTHWPDHGTPDPLNLVDFLRQFRHKIKPSHQPILIHCSAGIGRTGTFIALDVLSRYGKVKGKVNIIEYVKAMRKDRMTMIQNVDQYVFLYHALYEFFRRSGQFVRKDDFLSEFANLNKAETKKQLSDEFNELTSLKPKYEAKDYKSGKKHQKLNASKSVLPVEKYLVYLTSHIAGRDTYYNAINVSSFTQAEELISAQLPVAGAAIDLVRLLIDEDCSFLVSLNPMSEVKELKDWVNDNIKTIKLDPYEITKHAQTEQSPDIRKTNLKIKGKEDDILGVEILECMSWSSSQTVPTDKSILINFIKQFCLDRRSHPDGRVAVLSKDGAVGCGVFCAVYNAVQQIQQDAEVDMFTIVRQLQVRRPEMISTVEEYELCYDAVHQFLASDSVYANT